MILIDTDDELPDLIKNVVIIMTSVIKDDGKFLEIEKVLYDE